MMKIASVNTEFPPCCGGKGMYGLHLSKALRKFGVETVVFTRGGIRSRQETVDGIRVYRIPALPGPPLSLTYHARILDEAMEREKPFDLIHVHGPGAPLPRLEVPCAYTAHWCYRAAIARFYRPVHSLSSLLRNVSIPAYYRIEKKSIESCRTHSAVSRSVADELAKHYGLANVKVMKNGINPSDFEERSPISDRPVVLFVGKVVEGKGVLDLLDAFSRVRVKIPDAELWIVGAGELVRKIRRLQHSGNAGGIRILGLLPFSDVLGVYRQARVFVLPSYYEGMPNVILEAMASGLPVIGSNVSGIPDLVADGETGYLVPVRKPGILAERMTDLISDKQLCTRMGSKGRERALAEFTWEAVSRSYFNLFQEALAS
jgi:glycosyltransferase involved in cell wall biosynthesis